MCAKVDHNDVQEDKIAEGWSQAELGVDTTKKSKTARERWLMT